MNRFLIFVIAFGFVKEVLLNNMFRKVGEECNFMNDRGICRHESECDYYSRAPSKVKAIQLRPPNICQFSDVYNTKIIVCCPKTEETKPTKRSAVMACESYSNRPEVPNHDSDKILDGNPASPAEFPFFAALQYRVDEKFKFQCGGVLISKSFVLTAAHCVKESDILVLIRLGKTSLLDVSEDIFDKTDVGIKAIFRHPEYRASKKYYDIALVELEDPIEEFSFNVWPACLSTKTDGVQINLQIAGFGETLNSTTKDRQWMMKAEVEEIPLEECRYNYTTNYKNNLPNNIKDGIKDSQLCARSRKSQENTCRGDSGTGAIYQLREKNESKFYVYGITSFGPSCKSRIPSIYTKVSSYLDWIEEKVWPEKFHQT